MIAKYKYTLYFLLVALQMQLFYFKALAQESIKGRSIYYTQNYNENLARRYFQDNLSILDPIEGIWMRDGVTYAIEKDFNGYSRNPNRYRAVILDLPKNYAWDVGDIQFFIEKGVSPGLYNVNFYCFVADRSSGTREYVIKPMKAFAELNNYASLSLAIPNHDDYGNRIGTELNKYIRMFPSETQYISERSKVGQPTEWTGTGFALKDGYIVTNYHVVEGAKNISIQGIKGDFNPYNAVIVGSDKINDLALLKISDSSFVGFGAIPYSLSSNISEVGEEIFVLGYPLTSTMGDEIKLTTGVISSKTGYQGDVALYQISAPIQPGNSGGPLFDNKGNVIGIVNAKHEGAENVGYAIKVSYLRNLIESCSNASIIPNANTVSTLPLPGKVKSEKNFVFFIKCTSDI